MEIPQFCCPMKFLSQYKHETKLKTFYLNAVIVVIKTASSHVYPLLGLVFSQHAPPGFDSTKLPHTVNKVLGNNNRTFVGVSNVKP